MVIGIGIDLVEISRVAQTLARFEGRFLAKILASEEAAALPPERARRIEALALSIAGKEAASKALGTGWSQGVRWRDVIVTRAPEAAIRLAGRAAEVAQRLGSSGRIRARLERRGELAIGEVWLLS